MSLKRVLRYWTVRNKFEEARIHPDLAEIGVTNIRVEDQGLVFELQRKPENKKMATLVNKSSAAPNSDKTLTNLFSEENQYSKHLKNGSGNR